MRSVLKFFIFLGCLGVAGPAVSQEIVHAITGVVVKVDLKTKVFDVTPDDGSDGVFILASVPDSKLDFNKDVKAKTVPAATYAKTGTQVLIYFIGYDNDRTAIAVQELKSDVLDKSVGSIVKYDKHEVTIKDAKGAEETFAMNPQTVAEMDDGVVEGEKASPHKGMRVRVVGAKVNGVETALFVRSLGV